jgi:hypothetical protein
MLAICTWTCREPDISPCFSCKHARDEVYNERAKLPHDGAILFNGLPFIINQLLLYSSMAYMKRRKKTTWPFALVYNKFTLHMLTRHYQKKTDRFFFEKTLPRCHPGAQTRRSSPILSLTFFFTSVSLNDMMEFPLAPLDQLSSTVLGASYHADGSTVPYMRCRKPSGRSASDCPLLRTRYPLPVQLCFTRPFPFLVQPATSRTWCSPIRLPSRLPKFRTR